MQTKFQCPVFVVGCPRSGTTLLQSLLMANSQIASFPESHFFSNLIPKNDNWRYRLGIASIGAKSRFEEFLQEIEHPELQKFLPKFSFFVSQYVRAFTRVLDTLTRQQNKSLWIEKTPKHLHYIQDIEKFLPEAKFIHIIREGTDVVASLYDVTHKYPEAWDGARDIDNCVNRWIKDVKISLNCLDKCNHTIIRYEDLIENTSLVIKELCDFIDVDFEAAMLDKYARAADKVRLVSEPWKVSVDKKIQSTGSQKFNRLFNDNQRQYIIEQLAKVDLPPRNILSIENLDTVAH